MTRRLINPSASFAIALATASWVLAASVFYLQVHAQVVTQTGVVSMEPATVTTVVSDVTTITAATCGNGVCEEGETDVSCPNDCTATGNFNAMTPGGHDTGNIAVSCGNGVCETAGGESMATCSIDCGGRITSTYICGDAICHGTLGENSENCASDCTVVVAAVCGNGVCEEGETSDSCPGDCAATGLPATAETTAPAPTGTVADVVTIPATVCGNGVCEEGETPDSCPNDCRITTTVPSYVCGDAICEIGRGENATNCPHDCLTREVPTVSCSDSDGGKDTKKQGSINIGNATYADVCASATSVRERFCENGRPAEVVIPCGSGFTCVAGACVAVIREQAAKTTVPPPKTVITPPTAAPAPPPAAAPASPSVKLPERCVAAGIQTEEGCEQLLKAEAPAPVPEAAAPVNLPELCRRLGLNNERACLTAVEQAKAASETKTVQPVRTALVGVDASSVATPEACLSGKSQDCVARLVSSSLPERCVTADITDATDCSATLAAQKWPDVCLAAGVMDTEACRLLVEKAYWPPFCETHGLTTRDACRDAIFASFGMPAACAGLSHDACWRLVEDGRLKDVAYEDSLGKALVAIRCSDAGLSTSSECRAAAAREGVSEKCRLAGQLTVEACRKYEFTASLAIATALEMPANCVSAGITDPAACAGNWAATNLPIDCVVAGVSDEAACRRYLVLKDLPAACRDAGVEDRSECERLLAARSMELHCSTAMWQKLGPSAQWTGEQETACRETVFRAVASDLRCEGVTSEECGAMVKTAYLGQVAAADARLAPLRDPAITSRSTMSVALPDIERDYPELAAAVRSMLPVTDSVRAALWRSEEGIVINAAGSVIAAAPMVAVLDSDGDGLPDDVEIRHGLDPEKAMTDGLNPDLLALAAEADELAPVETALANGRPLGQPRVEGELDARLVAAAVSTSGVGKIPETVFSGRGVPGETVTIYLYSDLPLVMTTTVDANGEWSYKLGGSLNDGLHEVYVVVNDDTGKVVRKGDPLAFIVQAAQAATVGEALAAQGFDVTASYLDTSRGVEGYMTRYILGGIALVVGAGLVVLAFALRKRDPTA